MVKAGGGGGQTFFSSDFLVGLKWVFMSNFTLLGYLELVKKLVVVAVVVGGIETYYSVQLSHLSQVFSFPHPKKKNQKPWLTFANWEYC